METMFKQEKQLRVLAKWLKESDDGIDAYTDGDMERAVKYGVQECMHKIGDYLEEILDMNDEQLIKEMETTNKQSKYIVWVGGIPNHFDNLLDAQVHKKEWEDEGYDDVVIEAIFKVNGNEHHLFC